MFSDVSDVIVVLSWQKKIWRNMKTVDQLLQGMLSLLRDTIYLRVLLFGCSMFRHIYFCHERTTMTSETSENTIFVRYYFTLCYLILTAYGAQIVSV